MDTYHKIQSVFKRDMAGNRKLIEGEWSLPVFRYLAFDHWIWTEKIDGMNIRVSRVDGNPVFAGRTDNASIPPRLLERLKALFSDEAWRGLPEHAVLYGEGYGAKIQNGHTYRPDQDFVLFDVQIGSYWMSRSELEDFARMAGLDLVPIVGSGTLYNAIAYVQGAPLSVWGDFTAEGIVARPDVELSYNGQRVITKIKVRDFLI